jgi:hypothetical protein
MVVEVVSDGEREALSRYRSERVRVFAAALVVFSASACTNEPEPPRQYAEVTALYDSKRCASCHPEHYDEWSASMHAYAAEDPVFLAMNKRGQEETGGVLGPLCVNCHAPLAVQLGVMTDWSDVESVPPELRGVTCYFCHNTESVDGTHNNPLVLSHDVTMRGRIRNPRETDFHRSEYSPLLSGAEPESAAMCGACHDIVVPAPPALVPQPLERTYTEWLASVFAPEQAPSPSSVSTCTSCHMPVIENGNPISPTGPNRARHSHHMAGVDGPVTPFPNTGDPVRDAELAAAQALDRQRVLDPTVRVEICRQILDGTQGAEHTAIHLVLDNASAGHNFPSGAAQDRRAWTEVIAYQNGQVIYESGVVPDGQPPALPADPDLWLLRDETYDADGNEAHMFWNVAEIRHKTLPVQVTTDPSSPDYYSRHLRRRFPFDTSATIIGLPDRITVRMRIVPIGLDVLNDLVASEHLDAGVREVMPVLDLLPYRNDDFGSRPELAGLNVVTMEWTEATRSSSLFVARDDFTQPSGALECVGMPRRPR